MTSGFYMKNSPPAQKYQALTASQVIANLAHLTGWKLSGNGADLVIEKTYRFANYPQTMAFANAVAWLAQANNHHPVLQVHYGHCVVQFQTHDVGGLSLVDFDNAAAVDALPQAGIAAGA